jgi:hypothetical protein
MSPFTAHPTTQNLPSNREKHRTAQEKSEPFVISNHLQIVVLSESTTCRSSISTHQKPAIFPQKQNGKSTTRRSSIPVLHFAFQRA